MTFVYEPAVRENTFAVIGIAGPTGGGKTWTALELAMGLAGPSGKTVLIDTEGKRSLYYAEHFQFARYGLTPPYTPARFIAAFREISLVKPDVIITDSFSDEYIGEGGLCDMAEASDNPNDAAKWAMPKAEHKKIIRWIRNSAPCHLIFSMRAEEKVKLVKVYDEQRRREVTKVEAIGFQPICEKAFMFDMMESFLLTPEHRGVPQWIKPMEDHRQFFPDGKMVTRECGAALRAWCLGGTKETYPSPAADLVGSDLIATATEVARKGDAALQKFWKSLTNAQKKTLKPVLDTHLKPIAAGASGSAPAGDPVPPL